MVVSGLGAALLYGAWAFSANADFGRDTAVRAAVVQAAWSFAFTFLLAWVLELSAAHCERTGLPRRLAVLPALILVWAGPVTVHAWNGTPALAKTVAPGVLVGSLFVGAYVVGISRRGSRFAPDGLRREVVDVAALRRTGSESEKAALAKRIFAVWQPIFSHLDGRDYTFHLHRHVEDASAVRIRAVFGVDAEGRDRALLIVRVHEHRIGKRTWARQTINAGHDPAFVQMHFGQLFIALETWRYRLRHPLRPFFVVDGVVSAASYCAYAKWFYGFAPTEKRSIPASWWPLAEAAAQSLAGERIAGSRMEVRRFPAVVRDAEPRIGVSDRAANATRFYDELTEGDPTMGVLVMAPLSFSRYGATFIRFLLFGFARSLRPNQRLIR